MTNPTDNDELRSPLAPPEERPPAEGALEDVWGLCLSGGGYRAMLFHVGSLWRLNQAGYLPRFARISSVSGGSITAGLLALRWRSLCFDDRGVASAFEHEVVAPVRRLARQTIDIASVLRGVFLPGSIADRVANAYRQHLYGDATLQDLPDQPRFIINATNLQSGALWRFMKPYMRDWKVGEVKTPTLSLAIAVGASSAFPPFLSPVRLKLDASAYTPGNEDLHHKPFTTRPVLSDGGVYDNLGLETVWKRCRTVFVSDAGALMQPEAKPGGDWLRQTWRAHNIIDNQVRALRKRKVIESYQFGSQAGAYWGIRSDINAYGGGARLPCPYDRTVALANVATRLSKLDETTQERLINWGYAITDAALRAWFDKKLPDGAFPYPGSAV